MMYYVNWVLTAAQLDIIASDVCVVDYSYGRKNKKKRNKGQFDNTKASSSDVKKARGRWMEQYGNNDKKDDGGISIGDVFGGSLKPTTGFR